MRVAERILTSGRMNEADWFDFTGIIAMGIQRGKYFSEVGFWVGICCKAGGARGVESGAGIENRFCRRGGERNRLRSWFVSRAFPKAMI